MIARSAVQAVFAQTHSAPRTLTRRQRLMGGTATITLVGASEALLDACFELADRCEARWSRFLPASDISRLNAAEGREVSVDALTATLIAAMREGAALTRGDFDPTLLPWLLQIGYAASVVDPQRMTTLPDSARAPGSLAGISVSARDDAGHAAVRDAGQGVGYSAGAPVLVRMPVGTTLDAGGIGKGLTADLVCAFALAEGAWGVLAEIGGDIAVAGQPPGVVSVHGDALPNDALPNDALHDAPDDVLPNDAWRLGVEDPFDSDRPAAIVRLTAGALATSSQRKRRFVTVAGDNHHLLDPRSTGSAVTAVQTVSVIAATCARAEALTKPGFLRPVADYLAWLPTVGAAGLVIDQAGTHAASVNWPLYS